MAEKTEKKANRWTRDAMAELLEDCGEEIAAPESVVLEQLRRKPLLDAKKKFIGWGPPISRGAAGSQNVQKILQFDSRWNGAETKRIRFNEFAHVIEFDGRPITDADEFNLTMWLLDFYDMSIATSRLGEILASVAAADGYHPVRDWLESLPPWDGVERLGRLFADYLGAEDTPLHSEYAIRWCISAVARVMQPGVKADHVLILCGKQGCGKSTALRALAVKDEWFADSPLDFRSKDSALSLAGCWVWELAELDSLRRSDQELAKGWLASQEDLYRKPYDRNPVRVKRQTVFAGSSNQLEFLSDASGSRRYWPVQVGVVAPIDNEGLKAIVPLLWAEALHRLRQGEPHYLTAEHEAARIDASERYQTVDPWEIPIAEWLPSKLGAFTVYEALVGSAIDIAPANISRGDAYRMTNILQGLGCEKTSGRQKDADGRRRQTWRKPTEPLKD